MFLLVHNYSVVRIVQDLISFILVFIKWNPKHMQGLCTLE